MNLSFASNAEHAKNKSGRTSAQTLSPALIINAYKERSMTSIPIRRIPPHVQAPIAHANGPAADEAWLEHRALLLALRNAPTLASRPEFTVLRMDAYERFNNAFGGDV